MVSTKYLFKLNMKEVLDDNKKNFKYDLLVFKELDDYLCYVEAVHIMHH